MPTQVEITILVGLKPEILTFAISELSDVAAVVVPFSITGLPGVVLHSLAHHLALFVGA